MRKIHADVVVIGGGSTGAGVVRDLAMRGYSAVLVDRADLAQGTSGRFHGLLHSGGRYVVSDPVSATECAQENAIVTAIHADAVERTGGLFVCPPGDDPAFGDTFLDDAERAKVPCQEIAVAEALRREPRLNRRISRAIEVEDGAVDGWTLVWGAARSAMQHGATILPYHHVDAIEVSNGQVVGARCTALKPGERVDIDCGFAINAAGPWAGRIAELAGCHGVEVVSGRGVMVAMAHRLVNTVVNRLAYPADGDILVPVHTVCVIGTTDTLADDPDRLPITPAEVRQLLDSGETLVPGLRQARALHAWSGARPLVKDSRVAGDDTRHMSREMSVIDHAQRDGLSGFVTVVGGKLTTYRLMAKKAVDVMCAQLGHNRPCLTDQEAVPGARQGHNYQVTQRLAEREHDRLQDQIVCECELASRGQLTRLWADNPLATLDDARRQLRLGMGPCQGGFCAARAAGIACQTKVADAERATAMLRLFLKNRWIGSWPVLHGEQLRQMALDAWILQGAHDIEHVAPTGEVPGELRPCDGSEDVFDADGKAEEVAK
ncbi:MAG: anaerobic glycerol-3-phosphate dehydrogenase subunit A [Propionibacteriaceae bacterium]|jgi:glycerol-3-phosphate dehydrogenase|nr:anaerobic glycerol-3-phosphate dehydrogenase subunit A [Propionibacteriaceae bacterium]